MKPIQRDHSVISVYVHFSLLKNNDYCREIKLLIEEIRESEELTSIKKLVFFKYKMHQFIITFSKQ